MKHKTWFHQDNKGLNALNILYASKFEWHGVKKKFLTGCLRFTTTVGSKHSLAVRMLSVKLCITQYYNALGNMVFWWTSYLSLLISIFNTHTCSCLSLHGGSYSEIIFNEALWIWLQLLFKQSFFL